jgi:hypothetical protein
LPPAIPKASAGNGFERPTDWGVYIYTYIIYHISNIIYHISYIYVYVYVYVMCIYIYVYVHDICMYIYIYLYRYVCMYIYIVIPKSMDKSIIIKIVGFHFSFIWGWLYNRH